MRQAFQLMLALFPLWLAGAPAVRAQNAADPTVYVVRYIELMPAASQQGAGLLKQLADASRKETGVVRFNVLQRTAPTNQFAIVEAWKDQAALDSHIAGAHKQFTGAVQPLLLAPIDERPCIAIDIAPAQAMSGNARYVVTHVDVGPPSRDAGFALLKSFVGPSRKESGNASFDLLQQSARNNHFELLEIWNSQEAQEAHEISQGNRDFRAKLAPLLGALYDQRVYQPL